MENTWLRLVVLPPANGEHKVFDPIVHTLTLCFCCEATRLRSRLISVALRASEATLIWDFLDVCTSLHFASTSSNQNRGPEELQPSKWYQCGRENPVSCKEPVFRGRRVWKQVKVVQIPMTKADLFLRIFEAIPGTLKRPSLRPLSTCWRMRDSTVCYSIYFAKMSFYRMIRYWLLIVLERSKDITHMKLLSLVVKNSDICECKHK